MHLRSLYPALLAAHLALPVCVFAADTEPDDVGRDTSASSDRGETRAEPAP